MLNKPRLLQNLQGIHVVNEGHQVVFLGKTFYPHSASQHLGDIKMRSKISCYAGTSI